MRGSVRYFAVFAVALLGCGEEPKPLTGQAYWGDACPMNACPSVAHQVRGSRGSPTADIDCSIGPGPGGVGNNVSFKIASLSGAQTNFDDSSEGIFVRGYLPMVGGELQSNSVSIAGLGWRVTRAQAGAAAQCHVFIDAVRNGGFEGRIACVAVRDDSSPPRERNIRGNTPLTPTPEYGTFTFTNCVAE